jgi:hypothetical protein
MSLSVSFFSIMSRYSKDELFVKVQTFFSGQLYLKTFHVIIKFDKHFLVQI